MKNPHSFLLSALAAFAVFAGIQTRADNMASIAITPETGKVTLTPRWAIGNSLAGFHLMAQDLSLGGGANQFYSIKSTSIPSGGDIAGFTRYIAASGAATNHEDIGSKLTPNSYSALTSADPDVGYGSVNLYFIHHKTSGDYFSVIVPGSATASAVTDLKPMSGPGGPATLGAIGYFGLTFAAANLGYGLNNFYYLRTDPVTGHSKFGTLNPALLASSADQFDLGMGGHNALAFTGTDVGFGTDKMYYLRLDPNTGFSVLGTLHPVTGRASDIANLGSVFSTLTFVPGDVGFGSGQFYTTGAVNPTWQSVSFAAIDDRALSAGSFTVSPTASSGLPIALTVVSGSASIAGPAGGPFIVTPTASGRITLQATQAGQVAPTAYESNMLRQSFTALSAGTVPAGFDAQGYLSRYPDVAAIYGTDYYGAWIYFRDHGIYQGEVFDNEFRVEEYLALYPELFAVFGSNLSAALEHWLSTGRIEGRLGRIPVEFNAQGYFDRNPDVATAVNNDPILAWGHFWAYGIYEGRAYDDEFRVFEYLAINADLQAVFLNDWRGATLHWMRYGRMEGRLGRVPLIFNVTVYLSRNPDVAASWGTYPTTVFLHYWLYGIAEGRTFDDLFRPAEYLALNPDLAAVFGADLRGAFKHWVRYGRAEGRAGKNP